MHLISRKALIGFYEKHRDAKGPLLAWHKLAEKNKAANFNELKVTFATADYVPGGFTVFDIGGNKYRIVAAIHYRAQRMYIRHVFTHREYDEWSKENRKR